jgi:hypothetical protein
MLDRQKVETILVRRFPGAANDQVAAAANAIMGMGDEWEEVADEDDEFGHFEGGPCGDACSLAQRLHGSAEFRLLRRRDG